MPYTHNQITIALFGIFLIEAIFGIAIMYRLVFLDQKCQSITPVYLQPAVELIEN